MPLSRGRWLRTVARKGRANYRLKLPARGQSMATVEAAFGLAGNLGMLTIAEGIETQEQLDRRTLEGGAVGGHGQRPDRLIWTTSLISSR